MATYQHNIRLMANKTGDREVILVNQDESKSHEFNIKIFNTDDSAVEFPNLTNATLQIEKEDNTLAQVPMTSYTDGYFKFTPNVQAYTAGGDCNCFVQIISMRNGAQEDFIAGPFILRVQPTKFNRTVSENDFAQIGQLTEIAQGAESWAVGGTGTRPGEDTNNAKYWATTAGGVSRVDVIVGYASNNKRTLQFTRSGKIVVVESDGWINMGEMGVADRVIGTVPAGYLPTKSALTPYGTGKFLFTTGGQIIARYNGVGNFEDWFVSCTYTTS